MFPAFQCGNLINPGGGVEIDFNPRPIIAITNEWLIFPEIKVNAFRNVARRLGFRQRRRAVAKLAKLGPYALLSPQPNDAGKKTKIAGKKKGDQIWKQINRWNRESHLRRCRISPTQTEPEL